jgi:hypothetical protein
VSVQEYLDGVVGFGQKMLGWRSTAVSRRVLVAYPGEVVRLGVDVRGPRGHVVKVEVRGLLLVLGMCIKICI